MDYEKILSCVDHTLLKQNATYADIQHLIDDAAKYHTASVCIPPCFVKWAKEYACGKVKICTVIGFPHGNSTTETKVFEASNAVANGADEVDMVINVSELKSGNLEYVLNDIKAVRVACKDVVLKVIIETCLLTECEKVKMCEIVTESGADFIKTSTGFSTGGATIEDIKLFKAHVGSNVKIKAAGGIKNLEDAQEFIDCGASRLGTSRIVEAVKALGNSSAAVNTSNNKADENY